MISTNRKSAHVVATRELLGQLAARPSSFWRMDPPVDREWLHGTIAQDAYDVILRIGKRGLEQPVDQEELITALMAAGHSRRSVLAYVIGDLWPPSMGCHIKAAATELRRVVLGRQAVEGLGEAHRAAQQAYDGGAPLADVVAVAEGAFRERAAAAAQQVSRPVSRLDAAERLRKSMTEAEAAGGALGFTWGIKGLDDACCGLRPGQLSVFAMRLKRGKTHAAVHLAERVGSEEWTHLGRPGSALFCSLEMSVEEILARGVAWRTGIDSARIGTNHLDEFESDEVARDLRRRVPIQYVDERTMTVEDIAAHCRVHAVDGPLDLLVVDYLDLVRRPGRERTDLELGNVCRSLLQIAGEFQTHVLLLAQVNRQGDDHASVRHIAGSDEVARAAHHVLVAEWEVDNEEPAFGPKKSARAGPLVPLSIEVTTRAKGAPGRVRASLDLRTSRLSEEGH